MTALNSIVSPHFVDLYMSFLTSLLDAGPKGLPEIYEFSAQYFENKLKERSGETKKNDKRETIFQRDVPNSPGKKQFLPDFSYDSVLILPPKLIPPFTSFEENKENLLNKERQVICHLNDSPNRQEQGWNLLSKPRAFQENEGISRLANQDIDPDEHRQAFLEDQAMLKKEREIGEKIYLDEQQKKYSGSVDNDSKAQGEQKIILDLEKLLKEENQEKSMDHNADRKDSFKILFKDFDVFDKASNTEVDRDAFQNRFCTAHPNHCAVSQKEKKVHRKDQLEKQNIPPLDLHKNKMKLQMSTPGRSETFIDAQFSNGSKVLNQIVEFSKLLPVCLEVMSKMINGLEEKSHSPEDEKEDSYFTPDRLEIHERCPATLDESPRNDVDKQKTSDKIFRTTASQTDLVGSSELMKINSSVLTPAMLEYVCDVVKAAKRLLYSVTVKNYKHLPIEKITEDLPMSYGSEIGFNEFEKILEFWKDCLNKSENVPFQIDQNCIHESLEEQYSDSQRDSEEDLNAWQYESNKEPQYCQFHRKSNSNHDDGKNFNHPCDHQISQNRNGRIYSPVQEEVCQEREKCRDECELGKGVIKERDQNNSSSNESCSSTESSNHSSVENQKILDGINDLKVGCGNDDLSKSISDSVISSHSNQDANKKDLAKAFLSKLEKICQTNKDEDPFFRSSPGIIQISAYEPSAKGIERTHKSTGDLSHKQIVGKSKPKKLKEGKTEHKEKESFSLLDPRRSTISNEKEKMKNLLNYYTIHYNGYPKDKHGEYNHIKKLIDFQSSSDTDEDIKENAQRTLIDSEQRGPIHKDSSQFFISMPGMRKLQNLSKPVEVKKTPKSTGNLSKKEAVQWRGPRKRFTRMSTPKDKLQDPGVNGFFSLLDPKRSVTGIKASSYPKLFQDVGSTAVEAEIDDTKIVVHEIHQATSKLQMRILKARRVYKEAVSKTRTDRDAKDLDDNWRNTGVPVTGRSWLRSYFTTRMIRKYQKQLETDKIDNEIEDLSTPVLKHRECSYGLGSYFSQRSLFGSVRMWYFSRKLREYQRAFNS